MNHAIRFNMKPCMDSGVPHLLDELAGPIPCNRRRQLFQQRPRQRLHEVQMEILIQPLLQVLRYSTDIRERW